MKKIKSFIISDESINTYGFRLLTAGADLEQFRRNPVMYINHADWSLPIGRWENIRTEDGQILADPVFDMDDEVAREVAGKVERGFLKMASAGIRVTERTEDPGMMLPGQTRPTVSKWQLREVSIVGIGANHNALILYDKDNNRLNEEQILKLFDNPAAQSTTPPLTKTTMKKELLDILKLSDKASEDEVFAGVKKLMDDKAQLEADKTGLEKEKKELADKVIAMEESEMKAKKTQAEQLVDKAIREGKLNASAKKETLEFFDANFEGAKKMLEGIPGHKSIKDQLEGADKTELEKLQDKTWDELDKSGELQTLKDKYPDEYDKKYAEKFPKK